MSPLWLLLALPAVVDSVYRLVLLASSQSWSDRLGTRPGETTGRGAVLVPARSEGAALEPTLRSIARAAEGLPIDIVVVLDGADPVATAVAQRWHADIAVKEPAGPTKAATLAWAAERAEGPLTDADWILVLDVGSELDEGFFRRFTIPEGAEGAQAFLRGVGEGPGRAAALSEGLAQRREDCGREALGWTVRLRGTGFALRRDAFRAVAPELRTLVDDLEMSVLLAARGARLVMASSEAVVMDHKPQQCGGAARQRARWLVGQLTLPFRHPRALLRILLRRPFEALGFVGEIAGRPLSLTVPLRLGLAGLITAFPAPQLPTAASLAAALLMAGTALSDAILHLARGRGNVRSVLSLAAAWAAALILLPRALSTWLWARRD